MKTLDKKFTHSTWGYGRDMTLREFMLETLEDIWVTESKQVKKESKDKIFIDEDDLEIVYHLTDGKYKKKITEYASEFFISEQNKLFDLKKQLEEKERAIISELESESLDKKVFIENCVAYRMFTATLDHNIRESESQSKSAYAHCMKTGEWEDQEAWQKCQDRSVAAMTLYMNFHQERVANKMFGTFTVREIIEFLDLFVEQQIKMKLYTNYNEDVFYPHMKDDFYKIHVMKHSQYVAKAEKYLK